MAQKTIVQLQQRGSVSDDLNFPSDDSTQSYRVTAAQLFTYLRGKLPPMADEIAGLQLATSVASSALTIAIKTNAGTDPSTTDKIRVAFRNSTLTSGAFVIREISAATSLVVSSGSTLGQVSGQASRIWVYLIDSGTSPELAVSRSLYPENALVSTTAEGGAGAADSATVIYSQTARSNVPIRLVGYVDNTQTTAGTWASAGTQIQLAPSMRLKSPTVQTFTSGSGTYYTPAGATRIRVTMAGGGGGGAGSTTGPSVNGTAGSDSTFGTSLLTAAGGSGGLVNSNGTSVGGGGATINSPAVKILAVGGGFGHGVGTGTTATSPGGGSGGMNPLGGAGGAGGGTNVGGHGGPGTSNTGAGGGGAGYVGTGFGGGGGGAGGYLEAWIFTPSASYAYSVGAGGTFGGGSGAGAGQGGAGGSGVIIVEEFYD